MSDYKVLIIDYEPRGILQLQQPLEEAGFAVTVAKDGLTGIEAFNQLEPDLTLIEALLPKKNGFDVCAELKKTNHGRVAPVVIVTSVYKGRKYRTQALHNYGCDEYLEKPVSPEKLLEIVHGLIDSKKPPQDAAPAAPKERSADQTAPADEPAGEPVAPAAATDDTEREISDHLDDILGATKTERVLSFDPDRTRQRRDTPGNDASGSPSSRPSSGGADPALAPMPDAPAKPRYEVARPRPDASPIYRAQPARHFSFGAWFWIALVFVVVGSTLLFLLFGPSS